MKEIAIADIVIGERFRKDYGSLDELALSLSKYGLMHPVVVDSKLNLVAGGRRIEAAKKLGWTKIATMQLGELNEMQRRELELEENACRQDMTWQEKCLLRARIHKLKQELYGAKRRGPEGSEDDGGWGLKETAQMLGTSVATIGDDVSLGQALETMPELAQEKTQSAAKKKLRVMEDRLVREAALRQQQKRLGKTLENTRFVNEDALSYMKTLPTDSAHCIITDPPWGVDLSTTVFDDSRGKALAELELVIEEMSRILMPDGHLYLFFAIDLYADTYKIVSQHLKPHKVPLIWTKNTMGMTAIDYHFAITYEPILYCWNSDKPRKLNDACWATLDFPGTPPAERIHPTEKPLGLLRKLIRLSTVEGETVFDPFAGSASTLVAATQLGRVAMGCELNPDIFTAANSRLAEALSRGVREDVDLPPPPPVETEEHAI